MNFNIAEFFRIPENVLYMFHFTINGNYSIVIPTSKNQCESNLVLTLYSKLGVQSIHAPKLSLLEPTK
jgi:hypothetical protein